MRGWRWRLTRHGGRAAKWAVATIKQDERGVSKQADEPLNEQSQSRLLFSAIHAPPGGVKHVKDSWQGLVQDEECGARPKRHG